MSVSSLTSEDNQLNTLLAASTSYSLESTPNNLNKRICTEPNTSNDNSISNTINEDMLIEALGVCAINGYEAEVNHTIGLCTNARQDFNLLTISAKINIESYLTKHKHRIMYSCMTGNVDWFRTLYNVGDKNDIITLRTIGSERCLYHLLTMNPYDYYDEFTTIYTNTYNDDNTAKIEWDDNIGPLKHPNPLTNIPGRIAILDILSETALSVDTKDVNFNENTCLHLAIKFKEEEMFTAFLDLLPVGDINIVNFRGQTLLHMAISVRNVNIVKKLCTFEGINMMIKDKKNQTPILYAVEKGNEEVVNELLQYQHNYDIKAVNFDGYSVMHYAVMHFNLDMVHKLCTIPKIELDNTTRYGRTPLIYAVMNKKELLVRELLQYRDRINIDAHGNDRNTSLHIACYDDQFAIVQLLLEAGGDPSIRNDHGYVPLHIACGNGNTDIVRLLLQYQHKFDINAVDNNGNTALHLAGHFKHVEVVLLLETGVNTNIQDK